MATIKAILESKEFEEKCAFCGYNEHTICLTAHHVFLKGYFRPQPQFNREDRYLVLCPTCHALLHRGIFVGNGLQIIMDMITRCAYKYSKMRNIEKIIKLAALIYKIPYEEIYEKDL